MSCEFADSKEVYDTAKKEKNNKKMYVQFNTDLVQGPDCSEPQRWFW